MLPHLKSIQTFENVDTYLKQEPKNLFSDNASKGGSHESTVEWCFCQASSEEVDVVDVSVSPPQSLDHRWRDLAAEPVKVIGPGV